jgi:hypothetical protein
MLSPKNIQLVVGSNGKLLLKPHGIYFLGLLLIIRLIIRMQADWEIEL